MEMGQLMAALQNPVVMHTLANMGKRELVLQQVQQYSEQPLLVSLS